MSDRKYINYLDLTEAQKGHADQFIFTLGASLEDKIFVVAGDSVDALNSFAYQNSFSHGTHHLFCYHCRSAYMASIEGVDPHPENDCSQEFVSQFKIDCFDQAKACENLQTLREQFASMDSEGLELLMV
jgi:hypothetical protein